MPLRRQAQGQVVAAALLVVDLLGQEVVEGAVGLGHGEVGQPGHGLQGQEKQPRLPRLGLVEELPGLKAGVADGHVHRPQLRQPHHAVGVGGEIEFFAVHGALDRGVLQGIVPLVGDDDVVPRVVDAVVPQPGQVVDLDVADADGVEVEVVQGLSGELAADDVGVGAVLFHDLRARVVPGVLPGQAAGNDAAVAQGVFDQRGPVALLVPHEDVGAGREALLQEIDVAGVFVDEIASEEGDVVAQLASDDGMVRVGDVVAQDILISLLHAAGQGLVHGALGPALVAGAEDDDAAQLREELQVLPEHAVVGIGFEGLVVGEDDHLVLGQVHVGHKVLGAGDLIADAQRIQHGGVGVGVPGQVVLDQQHLGPRGAALFRGLRGGGGIALRGLVGAAGVLLFRRGQRGRGQQAERQSQAQQQTDPSFHCSSLLFNQRSTGSRRAVVRICRSTERSGRYIPGRAGRRRSPARRDRRRSPPANRGDARRGRGRCFD